MAQNELKTEIESPQITKSQDIKNKIKKWWLLPTMAILIIIPMILVLTFPQDKRAVKTTPIVENIFTYQPLTFDEFVTTVNNYSEIKQQYISTATKVIDIYLTQEEWNTLLTQNSPIVNEIITKKIIINLSNKLRLIGLIDSDRGLDFDNSQLLIELEAKNDQKFAFKGNLKYGNENEEILLPIAGNLNLSQEIIDPIKVINNDTMPKLLEELNDNSQLRNSINWNYYGFWYGLETIGNKEGNHNQWKGDQQVDLEAFNNVALAWFLDTLKTTNLIAYDAKFQAAKSNFYVDGWNPENLYLTNKGGLTKNDNYVTLSDDNWPWNESTNKPASIVSTIDFGWKNPLTEEITTINSTGAYILGPVWEYYDQA